MNVEPLAYLSERSDWSFPIFQTSWIHTTDTCDQASNIRASVFKRALLVFLTPFVEKILAFLFFGTFEFEKKIHYMFQH